jgi:predicted nucleotidyltransferase
MNYLQEIFNLREREKELLCIYRVDEILSNFNGNTDDVLKQLVFCIPNGLQFPGVCSSRITLKNKKFVSNNFHISNYLIADKIIAGEEEVGVIEIFYSNNKYSFLEEEKKLLNAICVRVGNFLLHQHLQKVLIPSKLADENHWKWKKNFAVKIAENTDFEQFDILAVYLIGSVKNEMAGPASDIDLIIHIQNDKPSAELLAWFNAWSFCLAEINFQKTGLHNKSGLLDLHYINQNSFDNGDSFARMIGNIDNSAVLLKKR